MGIKLIAKEGSSLRTAHVERCNAETHIQANDRWSDEARCLLAWEADESECEPIGWDGENLIFSGDIGNSTPVEVVWE